jgi:hypothetical protein
MSLNRKDKVLPCPYWSEGELTSNLVPCYCSFRRRTPEPVFKWQICFKVKFGKSLLTSMAPKSKIDGKETLAHTAHA